MLSLVSVISVNLISAVARPDPDSALFRAATRLSSASAAETPAEAQLLATAKRYLGTR